MKAQINNKHFIDLSKPIDISIPLLSGISVNAFHIPYAQFDPIRVGSFVGSVAEGGSANCENLKINAHGNGTHTECVGHISKEKITINQCLKQFHFYAELITVYPTKIENGDRVIFDSQIDLESLSKNTQAIIIRTQPNSTDKLVQQYSGNNPCYLDDSLTKHIREAGIKHLLIDLPSVDREEDEGQLAAHHSFWDYPNNPRLDMTITEMVYIPDNVKDGQYFINIQIAPIESDASPSKVLLYELK